jgi:4-hydroxybenzoate polyprenyltransferase
MSSTLRALGARGQALNPQPLRRRLAGHLALARISNSPTVVSNVLAGAALAGGLQLGPALIFAVAAMVSLYTAGMYLNDLFDHASDRERRRSRPLPSGVVSRGEAATVGFGLLALGIALLFPLGPTAVGAGLVLVGLIVGYDLWHKTNPLSPLVMAACRVMVYVTAYVAFSTGALASPLHLLIPCLLLGGYLVGLTYVSKVEDKWGTPSPQPSPARGEGASPFPSPSTGEGEGGGEGAADQHHRISDYLEIPSRFWPAVLVLLPVAYFGTQAANPLVAVVLVLFVGWSAYSLLLVYRPTGRNIGGAIGRLIAGISLLDGLVLASGGAGLGVLVALAAFGSTHVLQRYVKGT